MVHADMSVELKASGVLKTKEESGGERQMREEAAMEAKWQQEGKVSQRPKQGTGEVSRADSTWS